MNEWIDAITAMPTHRLRRDDGLVPAGLARLLELCGVGGLHGRLQLGLVDGRHFQGLTFFWIVKMVRGRGG